MSAHPRRTIRVPCEWHLVGHVVGLWCPSCNLPSGHEARYVLTYVDDPTWIIRRAVVRVCEDCAATLPAQ